MAWIKRNLFFVIGALVALSLLGAAGFYLFENYKANEENKTKLGAEYAKLEQLNQMKPHPGNDKVNNIEAAKEQQNDLRDFITRSGKFFDRIPPIPDSPKVTDEDFAAQLRKTIEQMQRDAASASVLLPPHYDFSFSAIKTKITFARSGLQPLAGQLGEVKAICDVLFHAKVNSLDSLRRERVSPDDRDVVADYIEDTSVTNDLAVLTPYEITFRSFSTELAAVLGGFGSSPYGFIVKSINVEPAGSVAETQEEVASAVTPAYSYTPPPVRQGGNMMGGGPSTYVPAPAPVYVAPVVRSGSITVLNEQPIKITLLLEVVKLNTESKVSK